MKKQKEFTELRGKSLQELIDRIKVAGYTQKHFKNMTLVEDYGNCYYEGDQIDIKLVYED